MPASVRLSDDLSKRVARLVSRRDISAHAFMLEAIEEKVVAEERRAAFHAEAKARLEVMERTGKGVPADEVFAWLEGRARGKAVRRPKARKVT